MAAIKRWAHKAFANARPGGSTHGALHRQLNVPENKTIPRSKLLAAARGRYGSLAKKRALPVINVQK